MAISTLSLPYLMSSPAADPHFGALNQCLTQASQGPRLGWAVAPDASRAATFGARAVTLCGKQGPATVFSIPGVTAITFDGGNRLWVATGEQLLHEEAGQLVARGRLRSGGAGRSRRGSDRHGCPGAAALHLPPGRGAGAG